MGCFAGTECEKLHIKSIIKSRFFTPTTLMKNVQQHIHYSIELTECDIWRATATEGREAAKLQATLWGHGSSSALQMLHLTALLLDFSKWLQVQHVTEFTSSNFWSNLTHAWPPGGNQFTTFKVWWIWNITQDWRTSWYKYGHIFSLL